MNTNFVATNTNSGAVFSTYMFCSVCGRWHPQGDCEMNGSVGLNLYKTCQLCGLPYKCDEYHYCTYVPTTVVTTNITTVPADPVKTSWVCCKCSRVFAPHVDECTHCNLGMGCK